MKTLPKTHLLAIDFCLFAIFILGTIISPPLNTVSSQSVGNKIPPKIIEPVIKYDSTDAVIRAKLDSLSLNTDKLKESTELTLRTTKIMKKQNVELHKHSKLIDQIGNKLKYDSISTADKNQLNLAKKKDEVCISSDSLQLPEIKSIEPERKGFINRLFHWRKK